MQSHKSTIPEAFFVVADYGKIGRETVIDWENCSRADAMTALREVDRPLSVQHLDPVAGTLRDVSREFAQAIVDGVVDGDDMPSGGLFDFCEDHLGCYAMADLERETGRSDYAEHNTHCYALSGAK